MVDVNNTSSNFQKVICGVPEGSIFCPLLFLCYISDMSVSGQFICIGLCFVMHYFMSFLIFAIILTR